MPLSFFNQMKPTTLIAVVIVLVGGAAFLILPLVVGKGASQVQGYSVSTKDSITSWSWAGIYKDGGAREAEVKKEIERLTGMLNKGTVADYDLYVGIASQYELLGDGKQAYQYLSKAIELDGKRGLAYMNMGHLMEELGAMTTAQAAYEAAVKAEPTNPVYQSARQNFMIQHTNTVP